MILIVSKALQIPRSRLFELLSVPLLGLLGLPLDALDLHHDFVGKLVYALSYAILNYGLPRCRCIISQAQMKIHVQSCVWSQPTLLLLCRLVLVVHLLKLLQHLSDKPDLLIEALYLYLVFRRLYVLFILNDFQVAQLDVLLQLIKLVVVLFQEAQQLPVIVLCEIKVLISLCQCLLELQERLRV